MWEWTEKGKVVEGRRGTQRRQRNKVWTQEGWREKKIATKSGVGKIKDMKEEQK